MKKNYLLGAMAAGLLLFTACSNDDDVINEGGNTDDTAQVLTLNIASGGDGLTTRAGRPLYSNEAAQDIENVSIFIRNSSNEIVYTKTISDWKTVSKDYTTDGHGKQYTLSIKGEDKLPTGTGYKVTAYGYSNSSDYDFTTIAKGNTLTDDVSATLKAGKADAEEVFAGELTGLEVNADKAFNITTGGSTAVVTLHRQVAGGYGYFKKIPATVDGVAVKFVRLVSVAKNQKVNFTDFNSAFTETDANVRFVVNGETSMTAAAQFAGGTANGAHEIYTIKIADWFTNGDNGGAAGGSGSANGLYDADDTWIKPAAITDAKFKKGSIFAGKFVIPFSRSDNHSTLELQLLAEGSDVNVPGTILKSWNINLPSTDAQLNNDVTTGLTGETKTSYSIVRNHMYNIGEKTIAEPTDPENPDPDKPEEPEDLSKAQDITLKVNDNWELIHGLELD